MRYAVLTLPLLAGCAAFQTGATEGEIATANDQIATVGTLAMPFLGVFAPFAPLAAGIAIQIGKLIRNKK